MLKTLVQGGRFDKASQAIIKKDPALKFHDILYEQIVSQGEDEVVNWANGPNSFVIVAMLESDDFGKREELIGRLVERKAVLDPKGAGARIILEKISSNESRGNGTEEKKSKSKAKKEKKAKA